MTDGAGLRALAARVVEERSVAAGSRGSGAPDASLDAVARALGAAADRLDAGDEVAARQQAAAAARAVGDGWSFSSTLGAEVLDAARTLG